MRWPSKLAVFGIAIVLTAGAAHFAWSALLSYGLATRFELRPFNPQKMDIAYGDRLALFAAFVNRQVAASEKPTVGFFGSSFTYGYPWPKERIFTTLLTERKRQLDIFNASIPALDMDGIVNFGICPMLVSGTRISVAFIEIPVVNSINTLNGYFRRGVAKPKERLSERCRPTQGNSSYAEILARYPFGLGWLPLLWDEEGYDKVDDPINIGILPETYFGTQAEFEAVAGAYREWLPEAISLVTGAAAKVFVYPSPIYVPGVAEAGGSSELVKYQFQTTLDICRRIEGVTCLDTSVFLTQRDLYFNLTHFNQKGHRAFAEWLLDHHDGQPDVFVDRRDRDQ